MTAFLVIGLGYGDEGKGTVTDYLTRKTGAKWNIRFNGGPQAGHTVVTSDGREHTFAQFGAGTLAGAKTYLSRYMLINPANLFNEAKHLAELGVDDPLSKVWVDPEATIITPYQIVAGQVRERQNGHGSCGQGIGECMNDLLHSGGRLKVSTLFDPSVTRYFLEKQCERKINELGDTDGQFSRIDIDYWMLIYAKFRSTVVVRSAMWHALRSGPVIFEGAQGVLLDEKYGWQPHTTWSNCTPDNALDLLSKAGYKANTHVIGVLRSYMTRHGAGPFVTEDPSLQPKTNEHNTLGEWQGPFRLGHFDAVASRYAITACKRIDSLAVTHFDALGTYQVCTNYTHRISHNGGNGNVVSMLWPETNVEYPAETTQLLKECAPNYTATYFTASGMADAIEKMLDKPVSIVSYGPTADDKELFRPDAVPSLAFERESLKNS